MFDFYHLLWCRRLQLVSAWGLWWDFYTFAINFLSLFLSWRRPCNKIIMVEKVPCLQNISKCTRTSWWIVAEDVVGRIMVARLVMEWQFCERIDGRWDSKSGIYWMWRPVEWCNAFIFPHVHFLGIISSRATCGIFSWCPPYLPKWNLLWPNNMVYEPKELRNTDSMFPAIYFTCDNLPQSN